MKEISIFVDESGDFGEYNHISPFYIVTMVFHMILVPKYFSSKFEKLFFDRVEIIISDINI